MVFEGDAKVVIDCVNHPNVDCSWKGKLIDDIQFFLSRHALWNLNFVKRSGNKVAHALAKIGMSLDNESIWAEEGPHEVMYVILLDKSCID